jgi:hypothetical protein
MNLKFRLSTMIIPLLLTVIPYHRQHLSDRHSYNPFHSTLLLKYYSIITRNYLNPMYKIFTNLLAGTGGQHGLPEAEHHLAAIILSHLTFHATQTYPSPWFRGASLTRAF